MSTGGHYCRKVTKDLKTKVLELSSQGLSPESIAPEVGVGSNLRKIYCINQGTGRISPILTYAYGESKKMPKEYKHHATASRGKAPSLPAPLFP